MRARIGTGDFGKHRRVNADHLGHILRPENLVQRSCYFRWTHRTFPYFLQVDMVDTVDLEARDSPKPRLLLLLLLLHHLLPDRKALDFFGG